MGASRAIGAGGRIKRGGRNLTDIFVIGGGPAGLAAGIAARKKGFQVTVADGGKPPLEKACGEGMMPDTVAALGDLGVKIPSGAGATLSGIRFLNGDDVVEASFASGRGLGMRRPTLHQILLDEAEACGVQFLWNTPVSCLGPQGVTIGKERIEARWIIGADGSRSLVRRWSGLDAVRHYSQRFARRRHYRIRPWADCTEIYWGHDLQAYVTPVTRCEIGVVLISGRREIRWEEAWREFPKLATRLGGAEISSAERGSVTDMRSLQRVYRGNIALLGDASGSVDAITGEGLRLSFRQALALAEAMAANDLSQYQNEHRELERRPAQMGRLMLLLGRHAMLRQRTIRTLSRHPEIFGRLLAVHLGETSARHIAATTALLGWHLLAA